MQGCNSSGYSATRAVSLFLDLAFNWTDLYILKQLTIHELNCDLLKIRRTPTFRNVTVAYVKENLHLNVIQSMR